MDVEKCETALCGWTCLSQGGSAVAVKQKQSFKSLCFGGIFNSCSLQQQQQRPEGSVNHIASTIHSLSEKI